MAFLLLHFPDEILRIILSHLLDVDIFTFYTSRRTCTRFQNLATDILERSFSEHGLAFHALLQSHFQPLIHSPPTSYPRAHPKYAALESFRNMPWASDATRREKYLREEATWYTIPLAAPDGTIVHKMDAVEIEWAEFGDAGDVDAASLMNALFFYPSKNDEDHPDYDESYDDSIYYNPPQGVSIGWLYEVLSRLDQGYPSYILGGGWELLFKERIQVDDKEILGEIYQNFVHGGRVVKEEEIRQFIVDDESCAVVWAYSGWFEPAIPPSKKREGDEEDEEHDAEVEEAWDPMPIAESDFRPTLVGYP